MKSLTRKIVYLVRGMSKPPIVVTIALLILASLLALSSRINMSPQPESAGNSAATVWSGAAGAGGVSPAHRIQGRHKPSKIRQLAKALRSRKGIHSLARLKKPSKMRQLAKALHSRKGIHSLARLKQSSKIRQLAKTLRSRNRIRSLARLKGMPQETARNETGFVYSQARVVGVARDQQVFPLRQNPLMFL